jgi:hypothetical protein
MPPASRIALGPAYTLPGTAPITRAPYSSPPPPPPPAPSPSPAPTITGAELSPFRPAYRISDTWYALQTQVQQGAVETRETLNEWPWLKLLVVWFLFLAATYVLYAFVYRPYTDGLARTRRLAGALRSHADHRL